MTNTVYEFNEEYPYEFVNYMTEKWADICTPIYVKNPKEKLSVISIGTGFLTQYKGKIFFVTAFHVLKEVQENDGAFLYINNKMVTLEFINFYIDEGHDITIAHFSDAWLAFNGVEKVKAVEFTSTYTSGYTEAHLLLGYPSTKNRLNKRFSKKDRFIFGFRLENPVKKPLSNTKLIDPIAFQYDHKDILDENFNKRNLPPSLKGMSGSPILDLYVDDPNKLHWKAKVRGVFLEWYPRRKEVIGTSLMSLEDIMQKAYNTLV